MNGKKKKKVLHNNLKKMDNLRFRPNNAFAKFFKELTKYKNDYQQYLNYTYIGIILCILLYIFKCIYAYAWGYKLISYNICTYKI